MTHVSSVRCERWVIFQLELEFLWVELSRTQWHCHGTSGYPWSDPIRLNIFSYTLSLIGIFLGGVPGANVFAPGQNMGWSIWGWFSMADVPFEGPFFGMIPTWPGTNVLTWTIPLVTCMSLGVWGPFEMWQGINCPAYYIGLLYGKNLLLRIFSKSKYLTNDGQVVLLMFFYKIQDIYL
jgi:hypothetical protein